MTIPELRRVESRNLEAEGYDLHSQSLFIQFKGRGGSAGPTYRYIAVPPEMYERFLAAPSKGNFLNQEIKGRYAFERLT